MEADNRGLSYLERRKLVKRWDGPLPALANTLMIFAIFGVTWWIFQDRRSSIREIEAKKRWLLRLRPCWPSPPN